MRRVNTKQIGIIVLVLLGLSACLLAIVWRSRGDTDLLRWPARLHVDDMLSDEPSRTTHENPTDSVESTSEADQRIYIAWVHSLVQELLRRDDGEALAVAGRLIFSNPQYFDRAHDPVAFRKRVIAIFDRAAELAPAEPVIQRMALWACSEMFSMGPTQEFGCDRAAYDEALRRTDSHNGTVWLRDLADAAKEKDSARQARSLSMMADATLFHDYGVEERSLMKQTVESVRLPPPVLTSKKLSPIDRLLLTWPHRPMQSAKPLTESCQTNEAVSVINVCLQITRLIREKSSVVYAAIALGVERRLASPGSAEAAKFKAEQRRLLWQRQQVLTVPNIRGTAPRYVESANTVEQLTSLLKENGIALDPPNDWEQ